MADSLDSKGPEVEVRADSPTTTDLAGASEKNWKSQAQTSGLVLPQERGEFSGSPDVVPASLRRLDDLPGPTHVDKVRRVFVLARERSHRCLSEERREA